MTKLTMDWLGAALIRAAKTFAQTMLAMVTVGQGIASIEWMHILGVSTTAALVSILTSVATGLPETTTHGTLNIDGKTHWTVLDEGAEKVAGKHVITLAVNKDANYAQYMSELLEDQNESA